MPSEEEEEEGEEESQELMMISNCEKNLRHYGSSFYWVDVGCSQPCAFRLPRLHLGTVGLAAERPVGGGFRFLVHIMHDSELLSFS